MRKSLLLVAAAAIVGVSAPSFALGLGDLAKVILNNGSVLTKGQQKCGNTLGLNALDLLKISSARSAAQRVLPANEFLALDQASNAEAETASQAPTFCADTKAKKKGLLGKIANAAKGLAGKRIGI
jgi:hypothetical protein